MSMDAADKGEPSESLAVTSALVNRKERSSAEQFDLLKVLGKGGYGKVRGAS